MVMTILWGVSWILTGHVCIFFFVNFSVASSRAANMKYAEHIYATLRSRNLYFANVAQVFSYEHKIQSVRDSAVTCN